MPKRSRSDVIHQAVIDAVQKERVKQGVSKYRIAKETGLSLRAIGFIERGERFPTLHTLLRIAEALKLDLGGVIREAEVLSLPKSEQTASDSKARKK